MWHKKGGVLILGSSVQTLPFTGRKFFLTLSPLCSLFLCLSLVVQTLVTEGNTVGLGGWGSDELQAKVSLSGQLSAKYSPPHHYPKVRQPGFQL